MFVVLLSPSAQKYLDGLDKKRAKNVRKGLEELEKDPFRPRSGCDIDRVEGSGSPPMYRLRKGAFRAEYFVDLDERVIYVTDLFPKKRDSIYREG